MFVKTKRRDHLYTLRKVTEMTSPSSIESLRLFCAENLSYILPRFQEPGKFARVNLELLCALVAQCLRNLTASIVQRSYTCVNAQIRGGAA